MINLTLLSEAEKDLVEFALNYLRHSRSFEQLLLRLEESAINLIIKTHYVESFAGTYQWKTQTIFINPKNSKGLPAILTEELFHAYQHLFYSQKHSPYYFQYLTKTTNLEVEVRLWRSYLAEVEKLDKVIASFEQKAPNPIYFFQNYFKANQNLQDLEENDKFKKLYTQQHGQLKKISIYQHLFFPKPFSNVFSVFQSLVRSEKSEVRSEE